MAQRNGYSGKFLCCDFANALFMRAVDVGVELSEIHVEVDPLLGVVGLRLLELGREVLDE